ncbi:hypothetical protein C8J56DRAFT_801168 [Mycena floridula]|nr:hypothetical protein C8J56DRAFT_801168 [Mycena floridula]
MDRYESPPLVFPDSDDDCGYDGGVNYEYISSGTESDQGWDSEDKCAGDELEASLHELRDLLNEEVEAKVGAPKDAFAQIMKARSSTDWKAAESNQKLGYNGHSERTESRKRTKARTDAVESSKAKIS